MPWPPILLGALAAASILLGRMAPLPWPGTDDGQARIAGLGLVLIGLILIGWAALTLRRHRTTVRPDKGADVLVDSGPYAIRRNPIYLGDVLLLIGAGVLWANLWLVLSAPVFAALVTWLAVLPEERHLEARFGDAWRDYASRVRRWI